VLPCSRFSSPLPDIERTLDVMAWVHVRNRLMGFDWILNQHVPPAYRRQQELPVHYANYTEVAHNGAYSAEAVYMPQDFAHIVSYAGEVRCSFRFLRYKPNFIMITVRRGIDVLVVRGFRGKGGAKKVFVLI